MRAAVADGVEQQLKGFCRGFTAIHEKELSLQWETNEAEWKEGTHHHNDHIQRPTLRGAAALPRRDQALLRVRIAMLTQKTLTK